ncbi:MAG: serine--tRNA ligase [Bdellovibrionales bacterium GWA2_49_15]|nr:MAG: serine--tRNA ligase [Bdellovibrionales bacterium GWA2_49_15]
MHDINYFHENTEAVKQNLAKRKFNTAIIDECLAINSKRKELTLFVETTRAEINQVSKQVGELKKNKQNADEKIQKVGHLKALIAEKEKELEATQTELNTRLSSIPNLVDDEVPAGESDKDNKEIFQRGNPAKFSFKVKDHVALGEALGMLDFEAASKMSGSRFVVYKGQFAQLERALINLMIEEHTKVGYEEIIPPYIVNSNSLFGTGQLPKFKEDLFRLDLPDRDWYLIPTAEVPVTNLKREQIFNASELPLKYVSYTPCFRSEAGSYGKDTRGLIRLHQFNKVEMVNIVAGEKSEDAHQEMIKRACSILDLLELPYRGILLCGADIGFSARKCIDLEVWLPSQNTYREISSISNCGDFQARRASIRYRDAQGKPVYAHTLNGSGLAVGRALVAVVENYQNEDGSITIPKILRPFMGGRERIAKI